MIPHSAPKSQRASRDASTTPFACTVMTAAKGAGHATKELIAHPVTGAPMKNQARDLGIWRGTVQHLELAGLAALAHLLPTLDKRQALIHGVPVDTVPDTILPLVMEDKLGARGTPPGAIARTLQHFAYRRPHLLMFDIDPDPYERYSLPDAPALMAKLASLWPVVAEVGYLSTVSTSSAVYDKKTRKELLPPRGLHVYILAHGDVPRFRDLATVKFWCADTGYCRLATPNKRTGVAAILERCLTDLSVWSPERLDYVAGADIDPQLPFVQIRPEPVLHPGGVLDLDALPDVTPEERATYAERLAAEKARVAPERFQVCVAHLKATEPTCAEAEVTQEATRRLALADTSHLAADHVIDLARGGTVLAKDLTRKHHNRACADPLEPDYGPNHAKIYWNDDQPHWLICSLAHGFKHLYFPDFPAPEPDDAPRPRKGAAPPTDAETKLPYSDYTNALAFVRDHGENLRFCYAWNAWLVWTGTHWQRDMSGAVMRLAKQTVKRLARHAEDLGDEAAQALLAHVKSSLSTAKLKALIENAQSEDGIAVQPEDLDTDPWVLNVANGTLDLRTGALRPHDRADLLTFALAVAYDQAATCPTWHAFLDRIMATNPHLLDFLKRAIGYALTGVIREHVLLILWGRGRNGKSTFLNLLRRLLGAYAMKAPSELLMVSHHDRHPTERADLWGKRFVAAIETEQGRKLAEVFVKEATGGDPIRARRMREDFWEFLPTHKVFLATNHKPEITGTDKAIWDRIKLVPFTVTIPEGEQDTTLPEKLEQELPGVLNWALEGCHVWLKDGLGTPDEVRQATAGYQSEMDVLGQFIDECCLVGANYRTKASALYDAYKRWCDQQGIPYDVQRQWGRALTERGFERFTNNGTWYRGLGVHECPPSDTEPTESTEPENGINSSVDSSRRDNRKIGSVPSVPSVEQQANYREGVRAPEGRGVSPAYCPGCGRHSTWLIREGREVCYKCGAQKL